MRKIVAITLLYFFSLACMILGPQIVFAQSSDSGESGESAKVQRPTFSRATTWVNNTQVDPNLRLDESAKVPEKVQPKVPEVELVVEKPAEPTTSQPRRNFLTPPKPKEQEEGFDFPSRNPPAMNVNGPDSSTATPPGMNSSSAFPPPVRSSSSSAPPSVKPNFTRTSPQTERDWDPNPFDDDWKDESEPEKKDRFVDVAYVPPPPAPTRPSGYSSPSGYTAPSGPESYSAPENYGSDNYDSETTTYTIRPRAIIRGGIFLIIVVSSIGGFFYRKISGT